MTYTANTGCVKHNPCYEDVLFASRLLKGHRIDIEVVIDSFSDIHQVSELAHKEQVQAFMAISRASLARFADDGEDYSSW
jgi:hypothetical protein